MFLIGLNFLNCLNGPMLLENEVILVSLFAVIPRETVQSHNTGTLQIHWSQGGGKGFF